MPEDRIDGLRVHVVRIPARTTHSHGIGAHGSGPHGSSDVSGIHSVLLELRTDTGRTGWGEASPWPVFTGTVEASAAALHGYLGEHVLGGDPVQVEWHMRRADQVLVGHNEAKAALETALLDLAGQISGLAIAELVGGRQRDAIPLSFSVANPDFDRDREDIESLFADGVRLFKVKTGFQGDDFDLMRLEWLRDRFGGEIGLRVDYNQGLPAFDALRRIRKLEAFDLDFIEQPVKRQERAAMAALTRAMDTPIMADESVFGVGDALAALEGPVADILSLKIMKSGGIRRALEVAAIAKAAGLAVYGGCMFETSIAHAAGAQLMAAVPELSLGCEFYMSSYYAVEDIAKEPFPVRDGQVHVPRAPGLGLAPDPDRLAAYRLELLE